MKKRTNQGTGHWNAKLTPSAVKQIRALAEKVETGQSTMTVSAIGRKFGIRPITARRVIDRVTWKHVS